MKRESYWLNLSLAALAMFYFLQFLIPVIQNQVLSGLGSDYRAFWSAGYIANHWGYAEIYNLNRLTEIQFNLIPHIDLPNVPFNPVPAPYFPFFLIPFQIFALLSPIMSFWVWELLNLIIFWAYITFFIHRFDSAARQKKIIFFSLLFAPVITNFWWGQPGVFLMICAGEFLWNWRHKKYISAGIWLSGWLFKPQLLVLILPALVFYKAWRILFSFGISSVSIFLVSALMLRAEGIVNYLHLLGFWGVLAGGSPAINPYMMINWRMLGLYLSDWVHPFFGYFIALVGTVWTIWLAFRKLSVENFYGLNFIKRMFGLFSATCIVTWHSHQNYLIILIPLFLYWVLCDESALKKLLPAWLYAMPLSVLLTFIVVFLMKIEILPFIDAVGGFIEGVAGLLVGLFFLYLANAFTQNELNTLDECHETIC